MKNELNEDLDEETKESMELSYLVARHARFLFKLFDLMAS